MDLGIDVGLAIAFIFVALIALMTFLYFVPLGLWIQAWTSGAHVGMGTLIAMRLRRVPPASVIGPRIAALRAGLEVSMQQLEGHLLAGGNGRGDYKPE